MARAGEWPASGTLDELRAAADRALHAARRAGEIEYRWNARFRLWERPADPLVELHTLRLKARQYKAAEIAEDRERMLRRLCDAPGGRA